MKTIRLIGICFLIKLGCFAQETKPDVLYKMDSTILNVYGLKFQNNQLVYRLSPSINARTFRSLRGEISRIRYADGKEAIVSIRSLPKPTLRTTFPQLNISFPIAKSTKQGKRPDHIYKKDRSVIECIIIEFGEKELMYVLITDESQQIRNIKRKEVDHIQHNNSNDIATYKAAIQKPVQTNQEENAVVQKKLKVKGLNYYNLTTLANGSYMIGDNQWHNPLTGYGHLFGWGWNISLEYYFHRKAAFGLRSGYTRWNTTLKFKEIADGPIIKQYINEASQIPILGTFRFKLGTHFYIMPEGGISFSVIKTNQINTLDSFKQIQLGYGLSIGYVAPINNWLAYDLGISYRTFSANDLETMKYASIHGGLSVSIR